MLRCIRSLLLLILTLIRVLDSIHIRTRGRIRFQEDIQVDIQFEGRTQLAHIRISIYNPDTRDRSTVGTHIPLQLQPLHLIDPAIHN